MQVMGSAGDGLLTGLASARQRLADALAIELGSYPAHRGYGSRVGELVDRRASAADVAAEVLRTIRRPENGLDDIQLVRVQTLDADSRAWVRIYARVLGAAFELDLGGVDETGLVPAEIPGAILTWGGDALTWGGHALAWGGGDA